MIVAEAGINHNGSIAKALSMIRCAKEVGCDAIKFQAYYAETLCEKGIEFEYGQLPNHPLPYYRRIEALTTGFDPRIEDMQEMFSRCQLKDHDWYIIKEECDRLDIEFMSTPMCKRSLDLLLDVGIKRIKVASSDLTNIPLLEAIEKTGLPVIISTGMADWDDYDRATDVFGAEYDLTSLRCTSEYPTSPKNVNISAITDGYLWYQIGLSDHTIGNTAAIMAVAYGATYFEKHFTLDNNLAGPDHWFSANPTQLKSWVDAIKEAQLMVGSGIIEPTEQEKVNRKVWRKTEANGYIRR